MSDARKNKMEKLVVWTNAAPIPISAVGVEALRRLSDLELDGGDRLAIAYALTVNTLMQCIQPLREQFEQDGWNAPCIQQGNALFDQIGNLPDPPGADRAGAEAALVIELLRHFVVAGQAVGRDVRRLRRLLGEENEG